jgi:enoyl-CoA hydratase
MKYTNLLLEIEKNIATITINRADKLNALNKETITELGQLADELLNNSEVKGIILTGAGEKAFVAGADIKELQSVSADEGYRVALFGQSVFNKFQNMNKPVIAAVNGFALGGGCEIAMACHFRYASENAKFGQPEVNLGLIPGYGGTQRLTRFIGKGRAMELLMTGDLIDANEAYRIGLVNKVVPQADLLNECKKILSKISSKAPLAIEYTIEAVNKGENMSLNESLRFEASLFGMVHGTDDGKEGCNAFLEKRKPNFQGK